MNGNPAGEFFVEGIGESGVAERMSVSEVIDDSESVLANEPIAVTAVLPFGEIAGSDGPAFEVMLEDRLNFSEGVEPFKNGLALFAVLDAMVELLSDLMR